MVISGVQRARTPDKCELGPTVAVIPNSALAAELRTKRWREKKTAEGVAHCGERLGRAGDDERDVFGESGRTPPYPGQSLSSAL